MDKEIKYDVTFVNDEPDNLKALFEPILEKIVWSNLVSRIENDSRFAHLCEMIKRDILQEKPQEAI